MSQQENLEIVQRGYKAFTEGDMPTLLNLLADDVEWIFPPTYAGIPWAQQPWRGRDGYLQAFKMLTELLEFQVFQPDEFIVSKDSVVVLGHERCRVKATVALSKPSGYKSSLCVMGGSVGIANTPTLLHGTTDTAQPLYETPEIWVKCVYLSEKGLSTLSDMMD